MNERINERKMSHRLSRVMSEGWLPCRVPIPNIRYTLPSSSIIIMQSIIIIVVD